MKDNELLCFFTPGVGGPTGATGVTGPVGATGMTGFTGQLTLEIFMHHSSHSGKTQWC